MVPNDDNSDKYILLSEVANNCTSLAKKWNCITDKGIAENHSLEDELINRALQQQLYLYCFMPISRISGKRWFFIWSDNLKVFLDPEATTQCNLFLVNYRDRIYFDRLADSQSRLMDIRRSDLYLNLDELKRLEENDQDFAGLVIVDPDLVGEEVEIETNSIPEEPNNTKPTDTRKEISSMPIIGGPIDLPQVKDDLESVSSSNPDLKTVATIDSQLPLASEIAQKSHSMAQAEKPKRTKLPNKKKEKALPRNIDDAIEPPLLRKGYREPLPLKTLADLQTRNLSLEDIIGDREKGIPAIIPVSRSTWYAGVKSGRYPKSFEVSEGRVAWRGSDIYALLQQMGMV
jgi:predicted DNA-binding transcriptional regulator AlpA